MYFESKPLEMSHKTVINCSKKEKRKKVYIFFLVLTIGNLVVNKPRTSACFGLLITERNKINNPYFFCKVIVQHVQVLLS